ncbi:unnamed protein product [Tuber aestivum]|uniref:Uncharacterized protein n=1 Tax=Tuber aestivum TaxID=59557 RepID=A0A292PSM8_9PEZI|nr:unnamed protein product [Tuber aestivum]
MGVTGLWTIANPCARPVKLESLSRKRLAVDASIWIYQFLKAVRDKEGHALQSSHIVGFFRRICKLLFFGIKPVFVFDGGAPPLKRQTIAGRKARREGRREDARRTAGRILALQVQRSADIEAERRRKRKSGDWEDVPDGELEQGQPEEEGEETIGDVSQLVYVDELEQTPKERARARGFRKSDPYHLPELPVGMESLGAPNDPRVMSQGDLEEYARIFRGGEEVNLYDFSKINFDSDFFISLPMADRYNILNAARLRSRMRMGLAKEQLDSMFPNRMDFSKFQVERVKERNDLTQRLMNLNGRNDQPGSYDPTRVAGEKGREYVLVRNDGVEGGWVLGVVGSAGAREGERNKPIIVDNTEELEGEEEKDLDDEEEFEDVPVEGLNRLPRIGPRDGREGSFSYDVLGGAEAQMLRRAIYKSKRDQGGPSNKRELSPDPISDASLAGPTNPLFLGNDEEYDDEDDDPFPLDFVGEERGNDDEELQKAIRLSLEAPRGYDSMELQSTFFGRDLSDIAEEEEEDEPINNKGKGKAVEEPSVEKEVSLLLAVPDEDADLSRAVSESRRMNGGVIPSGPGWSAPGEGSKSSSSSAALKNPFGGLLPFEPLEMGKSMLFKGKKPEEKPREMGGDKNKGKEKDGDDSAPLPPWFAGGAKKDLAEGMRLANRDTELTRGEKEREEHELEMQRIADERYKNRDVVMIDSDDGEEDDDVVMLDGLSEGGDLSVDDVAGRLRTHPPKPIDSQQGGDEEEIEWEESDHEGVLAARESTAPPKPCSGESPPPPDFKGAENGVAREATPPLEDADGGEQYTEPEDLELLQQLAAESEEHARFAAELNSKPQEQTREGYERELHALRAQQAKYRRDADEVTQVMVQECQQLLTLFGIPYITAPMEAEAQCAELVRLGLVDGIVTDDSDTFLFGGTRVYKNMFNQAKFVECYLASDLEKEYALDRTRLIRIAHLLGSDYTEGVPNVGPVTAMELLAEFANDNGLTEFKEWWTAVQTGLRKPADDNDSPFRKKFRKNSTKLFLPTNFPDPRVDEAYMYPEVDHDPSQFEWGMPDLDGLRRFLMATVGWSQERTDEVLVPVIKDMNTKQVEGTQSTITHFFEGRIGTGAAGVAGAPRRKVGKSKRMEKAMLSLHERAKGINGGEGDPAGQQGGDVDDGEAGKPAKGKSAKKSRGKRKSPVNNNGRDDNEEGLGGEGYHEEEAPAPAKKRKTASGGARK